MSLEIPSDVKVFEAAGRYVNKEVYRQIQSPTPPPPPPPPARKKKGIAGILNLFFFFYLSALAR